MKKIKFLVIIVLLTLSFVIGYYFNVIELVIGNTAFYKDYKISYKISKYEDAIKKFEKELKKKEKILKNLEKDMNKLITIRTNLIERNKKYDNIIKSFIKKVKSVEDKSAVKCIDFKGYKIPLKNYKTVVKNWVYEIYYNRLKLKKINQIIEKSKKKLIKFRSNIEKLRSYLLEKKAELEELKITYNLNKKLDVSWDEINNNIKQIDNFDNNYNFKEIKELSISLSGILEKEKENKSTIPSLKELVEEEKGKKEKKEEIKDSKINKEINELYNSYIEEED